MLALSSFSVLKTCEFPFLIILPCGLGFEVTRGCIEIIAHCFSISPCFINRRRKRFSTIKIGFQFCLFGEISSIIIKLSQSIIDYRVKTHKKLTNILNIFKFLVMDSKAFLNTKNEVLS